MDNFFQRFLERLGDILQGRIYAADVKWRNRKPNPLPILAFYGFIFFSCLYNLADSYSKINDPTYIISVHVPDRWDMLLLYLGLIGFVLSILYTAVLNKQKRKGIKVLSILLTGVSVLLSAFMIYEAYRESAEGGQPEYLGLVIFLLFTLLALVFALPKVRNAAGDAKRAAIKEAERDTEKEGGNRTQKYDLKWEDIIKGSPGDGQVSTDENGQIFVTEYDALTHEYKQVWLLEGTDAKLAYAAAERIVEMYKATVKYAAPFDLNRIGQFIASFSNEFIVARSLMIQGKLSYNSFFRGGPDPADIPDELAETSILKLLDSAENHNFLKNKARIEEANGNFMEFVFPGYKAERSKYKSIEDLETVLFGSRHEILDGYHFVLSDCTEFNEKLSLAIDEVAEKNKGFLKAEHEQGQKAPETGQGEKDQKAEGPTIEASTPVKPAIKASKSEDSIREEQQIWEKRD